MDARGRRWGLYEGLRHRGKRMVDMRLVAGF